MEHTDAREAGTSSPLSVKRVRRADNGKGDPAVSEQPSEEWTCVRDGKMHSRVLYPNPVCLLVTGPVTQGKSDELNAMVISWLTPLNNRGGLMLSINRKRFSAAKVLEQRCFVLGVASEALCSTLLEVGTCSGSQVNKFEVIPGLEIENTTLLKGLKGSREKGLHFIKGTVAQLKCSVTKVDGDADPEHWIVFAHICECYVNTKYWNGSQLHPTDKALPGILTFLGAKRFASIGPMI